MLPFGAGDFEYCRHHTTESLGFQIVLFDSVLLMLTWVWDIYFNLRPACAWLRTLSSLVFLFFFLFACLGARGFCICTLFMSLVERRCLIVRGHFVSFVLLGISCINLLISLDFCGGKLLLRWCEVLPLLRAWVGGRRGQRLRGRLEMSG